LIVADTGIGIPQSEQARVLEKFERGTRQSGAGLGLSLVKSLIELHGGTVMIESATGRGTRIVCRLPAARRELPGLGIGSPQSIQRRGIASLDRGTKTHPDMTKGQGSETRVAA
jgi:hypothetical protein